MPPVIPEGCSFAVVKGQGVSIYPPYHGFGGVAWIDLSRELYGLHGTPVPRLIGRSASHGCVRMTNWDVLRVAALVGKGTPVRFVQ